MNNDKVKLFTLYERQSQKSGRRYLTGRLGAASVIVFEDDRTEKNEGTLAIWDVYVQPTPDSARRQPSDNGHDRKDSFSASPPATPRRRQIPATRPPSTPDLPEDRVDDLWSAG
jgi:hypothetical protein